MIDTLEKLQVMRETCGTRSTWTTTYRGAAITVVAEYKAPPATMAHRVFVQESGDHPVTLGQDPPPTIYKTLEAAGEAGLRRAMAYLDRPPGDARSSSDY